jgi:hypothetical protein
VILAPITIEPEFALVMLFVPNEDATQSGAGIVGTVADIT